MFEVKDISGNICRINLHKICYARLVDVDGTPAKVELYFDGAESRDFEGAEAEQLWARLGRNTENLTLP
jgi:hypothetical protein